MISSSKLGSFELHSDLEQLRTRMGSYEICLLRADCRVMGFRAAAYRWVTLSGCGLWNKKSPCPIELRLAG